MRTRSFTNARLIDPATELDEIGTLICEDGVITELAAGVTPRGEVTDCGGKVLCPGLIDARVFTGEPGFEYRETLETAGQAAAVGGITTIVIQPNTDPVIEDPSEVQFIRRRAEHTCPVNVAVMAAMTKKCAGQEMAELALLKAAGAVAFTDGTNWVSSGRIMRRAMSYASGLDALIVSSAEDPDLATGVMNEGEVSSNLGLSGTPKAAEIIAVERDIRLAELTGARLHLAQASCVETLDSVSTARRRDVPVTVGASAHHIALNENDVGAYRTFTKVRPPLRHEDDRAALAQAAMEGEIDVIASSHEPQDEEAKRLPFTEAAPGAAGLETLLPILLGLHHDGAGLATVLKPVTSGPADLLGLPAGRLTVGAPADLAVIDPDVPWVLEIADLHSKSKNTPFEGCKFMGRAIMTVVAGNTVFDRNGDV